MMRLPPQAHTGHARAAFAAFLDQAKSNLAAGSACRREKRARLLASAGYQPLNQRGAGDAINGWVIEYRTDIGQQRHGNVFGGMPRAVDRWTADGAVTTSVTTCVGGAGNGRTD